MEKVEQTRLGSMLSRVKSMFKLDFYRLFHTPVLYIMLLVAAIIPAMLLTMSGMPTTDPATGVTTPPAIVYDNVWQVVETLGGSAVAGDPLNMAGYANINMVFIFAGLLISIFVAHDYSSGFVKNIFTVHSKKVDYVLSKSIVGAVGGAGMLLTYLLGGVICGGIMQKSFSVDVGGLIACLLSKFFLMLLFSALFVSVSVFFKNKLWLTITFTFLFGMMLYPVASVATLSASLGTVVITLVIGLGGGIAIGCLSTTLLNKRDLV